MKSYLERLAAAAISPGGTFHPLAASLYAPTADSRPPAFQMLEAEAQGAHEPASPANAGLQAPLFDQNPSPRDHEQSPPLQVSTSAMVPPLQFPATLPSLLQPLASRAPTQARTPEQLSQEEDSVDGHSSHGEPSTGAEEARPLAAMPPRTSARTMSPRTPIAMAESQGATQSLHRDPTAESAPSSADTTHALNPRNLPGDGMQAQASRMKAADSSTFPSTVSPSTVSALQSAAPSTLHKRSAPDAAITRSLAPPDAKITRPLDALDAKTTRPLDPPAHEPVALTASEPATYQPLVADYAPRPPALSFQSGQQGPSTQGLRERSRELESRAPDEIQIHIGRIEVTAFQPAPAVLPQPAHRKTPSLDAYLRRGHGRA